MSLLRLPACSLVMMLAPSAATNTQETCRLEAEDGVLQGGVRLASDLPGFSGRGYLTGFIRPGDAVDLTTPKLPIDAYYTLGIRYACDDDKRIPVSVNGHIQGNLLLAKTQGFETRDYGRVFLSKGENTIRIGTDWGYSEIDCILLTPAPAPKPFQLSTHPATSAASPEVQQLFTRLTDRFGRYTFAGQHDSFPQELSRLDHITRLTAGKMPAILGLDLIYYSPAWEKEDGDGAIEKALWWSRERKGIVTLSWHWLSPFGATGSVWSSFNTSKTSFDVRRIVDQTSPEYLATIRDIDHIARKLAILRDAGVPILWRPLHEAEGGWFWWGAHGPGPAKHLYRLLFDRFIRTHRLNNLLWVWTSTADANAIDWYPGDDVTDIIASDLYFPAGTQGDFFTSFDRLHEIYAGRKPLALGECGALPRVNQRASWLWFLVWDDFIQREDMNTPASIRQAYNDPRIKTLAR